MADRLGVFAGTTQVGSLEVTADGRWAFEYADAWLSAPAAFAISVSLPLRTGSNDAPAVRAFFVNLLPEGPVRQAIARKLGLSVDNDVALLAAVGGECAGALSLLPGDRAPVEEEATYRPLSPQVIAKMARRYSVLAGLTGEDNVRLSLAGAQDKLPVLRDDDGAFWLPEGSAPSTHILKVPSRDFKHLPANEVLTTKLAHAVGLRVIDVELVRVEDVDVAVIGRYDRARTDAGVRRLHQEDLCQALGLLPSAKYQEEGGPTFADAVRVVRETSISPLTDVLQLIRWLAFSLAAGNADGHGKNLSVLYGPGTEARLAPFYDLVCTRAYPRLDRRLAMAVGSQRDPGQIGRRGWTELADAIEVGPRLVIDEVERIAAELPEALERVASEHSDAHGDTPAIQLLRRAVRRQCKRTLKLLG